MKRIFNVASLLCSILACSISCYGQREDSTYHLKFLPPGINFTPLKANIKEPRIGLYKFTNRSAMKVDIGNSIDIVSMENDAKRVKFTAGIDFIGYALTDAFGGFRLQIDALDGLFGGNISMSKQYENSAFKSRLRILHHSAHYVDGHFIPEENRWIDNRGPSAFTRDFGEIMVGYETHCSIGMAKLYGGYSHATLIRPVILGRDEALCGGELWNGEIFPSTFDKPVNLFFAYQFTLLSTPAYCGANQFQLGSKFGNWNEKGIVFYIAYYTGPEMYGQYIDLHVSGVGAGFMIDFF